MSYYKKKHLQKMVPWTPNIDMTLVSVSAADKKLGCPKEGDMIASNAVDSEDRWLVEANFFKNNYEYFGE